AWMWLSSPSSAHPIRSGSSDSTIPTTGSPPSDRSKSSSSPSRVSGSPRMLATLSPTRSTRPIMSSRGSALSWLISRPARLRRSFTDSASVLIAIDLSGGGGQPVAPVETENRARECDFGAGDKRRIALELYKRRRTNPLSEFFAPMRFLECVERMSRGHDERTRAEMRNERGPFRLGQTVQMIQDAGQKGTLDRREGQLAKQPFRQLHGKLDCSGKQLLSGGSALFAQLRGRLRADFLRVRAGLIDHLPAFGG